MNYSNGVAEIKTRGRWNAVRVVATVIRIVLVLEVVVFALAAMMHAGVPVPMGFTERVIVPAAIVEGAISFFIAVSAYGVFANRAWAWTAATFAHAFGVGGVLLGITVLALGGGPVSDANYIYHRVSLAVAGAMLLLLLLPVGRVALGRKRERDL